MLYRFGWHKRRLLLSGSALPMLMMSTVCLSGCSSESAGPEFQGVIRQCQHRHCMIGSKIAGQILQTWSAICSQPSSVCVRHVMLVSTAAAAFKLSWQPSAVYLCIFMRLRIGAGMPHKAKGFTMVYQYKPAKQATARLGVRPLSPPC
jgi:hypothetical protein